MAESVPQSMGGGVSLEDILWRNASRWSEGPALVDRDVLEEREEFVNRIHRAFDGELPAEEFVGHFFGEDAFDLSKAPADMAEAIVRASKKRMQVYEFDLDRFEYVVLEEEDKVVVVSDFGQFAVENNDVVRTAIESAIIPALDDVQRKDSTSEPRAYYVRRDGSMVAMDVPRLARVLDQLAVTQVTAPAVTLPSSRLWAFDPVKKTLDIEREVRIIREERKAEQRKPSPPPPPQLVAGAPALPDVPDAPPANADTTLMLVMPDGSLARPNVGAPGRWRDLISDWLVRSSALSLGANTLPAGGQQKFAIESGKVVALFSSSSSQKQGAPSQAGLPGLLAQRMEARGDGIALARGGSGPIRVLGDDELAVAISRGAMIVPGFAAIVEGEDGVPGDRFWMQPEAFFAPSTQQKQAMARGALDLDSQGTLVAGADQGREPKKLGDITGDPWADWAMAAGGSVEPEGLMLAARGRDAGAMLARSPQPGVLLAAMARADATGGALVVGPNGRELRLPGGEPIVAFTAPDGSLMIQRRLGPMRLADLDRPEAASLGIQLESEGQRRDAIGSRAGSLPSSLLAALTMALERSASAGGFRLPQLRIDAAANAVPFGASLELPAGDPRRGSAMLMGAPNIYAGSSGQVARMLLSLPFPSRGEVNVGPDLSEALQAYLDAPVLPASSSAPPAAGAMTIASGPAVALGGAASLAGAAPGIALRMASARQASRSGLEPFRLSEIDWGEIHGNATQRARNAVVTLQAPEVASLLSRGGPSVAGLPRLLARALDASGDWIAGPGAPTPSAIRRFALQVPVSELAVPAVPIALGEPEQARRPLSIGEDEIVIPMPLWAQMGRGRISATDQIMASRFAASGVAPPLGGYRLVVPRDAPYDFTGGLGAAGPGVVCVSGPTSLELGPDAARSSIMAQSPSGRFTLADVALDDGEPVARRNRMRIGAPLSAEALVRFTQAGGDAGELGQDAPSGTLVATEQSGQQAASRGEGQADFAGDASSSTARTAAPAQAAQRDAARQSEATEQAAVAQRQVQAQAQQEQSAQKAQVQQAQAQQQEAAKVEQAAQGDTQQRGDQARPSESSAEGEPQSPRARLGSLFDEGKMTSALQGALRTSDEVAARLAPIPDGQVGPVGASSSAGSPDMSLVASPAQKSEPASAPQSASSASSDPSPASSPASSSRSSPSKVSLPSRSPVALPAQSNSARSTPGVSESSSADRALPSTPSRSIPAASSRTSTAELERGSSEAVRYSSVSSRRSRSSSSNSDDFRGLPRGAWSGHNRADPGYTSWSYSSRLANIGSISQGGISLAGLGRPIYPALPTSLRFRYVSAPLWWSSSSRSGGASAGLGESDESEGSASSPSIMGGTSSSSQRALRAGLRAANSAATLWRSILVRGPAGSPGSSRSAGGDSYQGEDDDQGLGDAGAMDRNWDSSAAQLSSLASRFDLLNAGALATGAPQASGSSASSGSDAAQTLSGSAGAMAMVASQNAAARPIGNGPSSLYVAVDQAGKAGMVDAKAAVLRDARSSVQMSIVAAIPQQPPSLESMSELSAAHTRKHGGGAAAAAPEAGADAGGGGGENAPAPSSKIEGSVDAIAQRIYHRIRRRIASDRERFGG